MFQKVNANRSIVIVGGAMVCIFALAFWLLFTTARKQNNITHRASCQSNLRQLGVALAQYATDNDDCYPSSIAWIKATGALSKAHGCPATAPLANLPRLKASGVPGYALNTMLAGRKRSTVGSPANTVAVCEQAAGISQTRSVNPYDGFPLYPQALEKGWTRHGGGAHYLFCDGHVQWYAPGEVRSDTANDISDVNNGVFPTFIVQTAPLSQAAH